MKNRVLLILAIVFLVPGLILSARAQPPELVVQVGHSDHINKILFSPNDKLLASGSSDRAIKLWDVASGIQLRVFQTDSLIRSISFDVDGKMLASGEDDNAIRLWDVKTGAKLKTLGGNSAYVNALAFSPNNKILVSGNEDGILKFWDVATGNEIKTLTAHFPTVNELAFSPNGKILASAGMNDKEIKLWNAGNHTLLRILKGHGSGILSISFSPDGKKLVSTGWDETVRIWDVASGAELKTFSELGDWQSVAVFSPDGRAVTSVSSGITITTWDIASGKLLKTLSGEFYYGYSVAISHNLKKLASGGGEKVIDLWETASRAQYKTLFAHSFGIGEMIFSPDDKILGSFENYDNTIRLWNVESGETTKSLTGHTNYVESIVFSPDSKLLASRSSDETVRLWNLAAGTILRIFPENSVQVLFSPDSKSLISIGVDGTIKVWDVESGTGLVTYSQVTRQITKVSFSPDGKILAGATEDHQIVLWNNATGEELKVFQGHTDRILSIDFGHRRGILVTASNDKTIRLWDVTTGKSLKTLPAEVDQFSAIAISEDDKTLAFSNLNETIIQWEIENDSAPKNLNKTTPATKQEIISRFPKLFKQSYEGAVSRHLIAEKVENVKIRLSDKSTSRELANLIPFGVDDWLVITREGFFDGTPAAWKRLLWRFNRNTFDYGAAELYFNDFFYPNLLSDVLAGKPLQTLSGDELEKKDRRQPEVRMESLDGVTRSRLEAAGNQSFAIKRNISVVIEITDNKSRKKQPDHQKTSGAQDLRLFRNGTLVKVWHGSLFDRSTGCKTVRTKSSAPRRVRCRAEIPVIKGENILTAYAFNTQNVKSNDDSISVQGAASLKKEGTLYILSIGIDRYSNADYNLPFSVSGIEQVNEAVKKHQLPIGRFRQTEIVTLTDESATRKNILATFAGFAKERDALFSTNNWCLGISEKQCRELTPEINKIKPLEPEDALLVHFLGHGSSFGARFYFLPHNFPFDGSNEAYGKDAVSDIELNNALEKIDAGQLLMIIDACRSGQAIGDEREGRAPMNSKGLAQLAYDKGMLILTASQNMQSANQDRKDGRLGIKSSLLAFVLLKAFSNFDADKDQNHDLTARQWFDYAALQVPVLHDRVIKNEGGEDLIQLSYLNDDYYKNLDPKLKVQTPRIFYRRDAESNSLILAKPKTD